MNILPLDKGVLSRYAGVAALAVAGFCLTAAKADAEEWAKSYTVAGRARVRVETNDGAVRVSTGDTKQVELRVIYEGYKLDKNLTITSHQDGDQVEISARLHSGLGFSWGINHRTLRIEVRMPKEADLNVDTGDGSVETQPLTGSLDVHTGDGHIRVDGARGDIRLRTGDGSIEGRDLDGKVDADTGDGHVTLEGRFDALNIKTGDGSVTARVGAGSQVATGWKIHTGDGSVDLTLPGDLKANIDASTHDGRISLGIPVTVEGTFSNSRISGKMNGGGEQLLISTGDGSIHLSKT
jgi:DUF4097 and DUF4098 domain-containing protein YvlB